MQPSSTTLIGVREHTRAVIPLEHVAVSLKRGEGNERGSVRTRPMPRGGQFSMVSENIEIIVITLTAQ